MHLQNFYLDNFVIIQEPMELSSGGRVVAYGRVSSSEQAEVQYAA
jgi:predicted site-specific integrase-resolvase